MYVGVLPNEIWDLVFSFLTEWNLGYVMLVCRDFLDIVHKYHTSFSFQLKENVKYQKMFTLCRLEGSSVDRALVYACYYGYKHIVKYLLRRRSRIFLDKALIQASCRGHKDTVLLLLSYPIQCYSEAFFYACLKDWIDIVKILAPYCSNYIHKGLQIATRVGNTEISDLLLDISCSYVQSARSIRISHL